MTSHAIPQRFTEPLTPQTLGELFAYNELLQLEVERVKRVCDYWVKNNLMPKVTVSKAQKLRAVR